MADNILPFPVPHRGDPDPRRMALAAIRFHWRAEMWRRGRVALSDAAIDAMETRTWAQCLRRWTRRCPRARESCNERYHPVAFHAILGSTISIDEFEKKVYKRTG
jgi:hypothetical protein